MEINEKKLKWELENAGIPIEGCNTDGVIWFLPEATDEQKKQAQIILKNHTPYWYWEERQKAYPDIREQLDGNFKGWKSLLTFLKTKFPKEEDQNILDGCIEQIIIPCQKVKDSIPKQ